MLPYSRGLLLDNAHNYGIMKTEAVFGFAPNQNSYLNNSFNNTEPLKWIFGNGTFEKRSLQVQETPKADTIKQESKTSKESKHGKKAKKKKRKGKKINKCIIKFLKKGQGQSEGPAESGEAYGGKKRRRRRGGNKIQKMQKKYLMPVILGLLAAKSLLIPVALKALAFMSAKGLMLAFFSTVLASVISLKGMFNQPQEYHKRNDDAKTQVEIIQVPTKSEDHVYYDDVHYKRGDFVQFLPDELDYRKGDYVMPLPNDVNYRRGDYVLGLPNDVMYRKSDHWKGIKKKNVSGEKNSFKAQGERPILMNQ